MLFRSPRSTHLPAPLYFQMLYIRMRYIAGFDYYSTKGGRCFFHFLQLGQVVNRSVYREVVCTGKCENKIQHRKKLSGNVLCSSESTPVYKIQNTKSQVRDYQTIRHRRRHQYNRNASFGFVPPRIGAAF